MYRAYACAVVPHKLFLQPLGLFESRETSASYLSGLAFSKRVFPRVLKESNEGVLTPA